MFGIIVIAVILLWYIISKRNKFYKLHQAVKEEGGNVGIMISKRSACLNDALNIAKLSYGREVEGIEKLTAADQLSQLAYLGEKYPTLQSVSGYNHTLQEAFRLNEDISAAQELLNSNIRIYNEEIGAFPALLVAKLLGYKREQLIDEENYEQNKQLNKSTVDFSRF